MSSLVPTTVSHHTHNSTEYPIPYHDAAVNRIFLIASPWLTRIQDLFQKYLDPGKFHIFISFKFQDTNYQVIWLFFRVAHILFLLSSPFNLFLILFSYSFFFSYPILLSYSVSSCLFLSTFLVTTDDMKPSPMYTQVQVY